MFENLETRLYNSTEEMRAIVDILTAGYTNRIPYTISTSDDAMYNPGARDGASIWGIMGRCALCGEFSFYWNDVSSMKNIDGVPVCSRCASDGGISGNEIRRCENCNQYHFTRNMEQYDRDYYCRDCFNTRFYHCDRCGRVVNISSLGAIELFETGQRVCYDCYERFLSSDDSKVKGHGYKKDNVHHYTVFPGENTYGWELEIDGPDAHDSIGCASEIQCLINRVLNEKVLMKMDGSLENKHAFEIVIDPMSINYMQREKIVKIICETARKYGYLSHDTRTCGFHIHAGKNLFNNKNGEYFRNIAKLILLVEKLKPEIIKFSRRKYFRYCRFFTDIDPEENQYGNHWAIRRREMIADIRRILLTGRYTPAELEKIYDNAMHSFERYVVVNVRNSPTVELRINRGTLNQITLYASLQLYEMLIKISTSRINPTKVTFDRLKTMARKSNFKEFLLYCEKRKI